MEFNMAVIHFSEEGFDKAVSAGGLVMVDFWASWCGPCRMLAPVIDALAEKYEGKAIVGKVDVDAESALARRFGVMSIPTVIFFQNGAEVERKVGVMPQQAYADVLDARL
ncbi:MAG TPA: thioredoxin [Candidatus Galloscillospira stercoripullorum]|nr:thioredoxin [Candidatus Galloscillospira stercoripullorum]